MALPASFEDTLRRHDAAVFKWLGGLRVDYGAPTDFPADVPLRSSWPTRQNHPILRTMATRDRAFATVVDLLVSSNWIDAGTAQSIRDKAASFAVLPLPIATFERGDPEFDNVSLGVPKRFRRSAFNQATLRWESHPWPGVYRTPYRVTFWCRTRSTHAFISEWIYGQLGKLGANDREVLIQVAHRDPWGTQWQSMRLDGSSDNSDLEGDDPRFLRVEFSFSLRMLHMRPNVEEFDFINSGRTDATLEGLGDGSEQGAFERTPDLIAAPMASDNLFTFYYRHAEIAQSWPVGGGATIREATIAPPTVALEDVLEATVRAVTDRVGIANRPVFVDSTPGSVALLSIAMTYRATAEATLAVHERAGTDSPASWTSVRRVRVPVATAWTDFQVFTLLDQPIFSAVLEGRALDSIVRFTDVSVRHVFNAPPIEPTGYSIGIGGGAKMTWNALPRHRAYLLVVVPGSHTDEWLMRVEDDESSPNYVIERLFDTVEERGFVELVQPKASSIALTVPIGFPASTYYLQPYSGEFRGRLS